MKSGKPKFKTRICEECGNQRICMINDFILNDRYIGETQICRECLANDMLWFKNKSLSLEK